MAGAVPPDARAIRVLVDQPDDDDRHRRRDLAFPSGLLRTVPPRAALAVVAAVAFSPPVVSHAFLVFPEAPALWATCATIWLACLAESELTWPRVMAVVAAVAVLPWLHRKYSLYIFGLFLLVAWQQREWLRRQPGAALAGLAALAILPEAALHMWTLEVWGNLGGPHLLGGSLFSIDIVPRASLGLLFDRERGLVSYAPIYLLAPACWLLTWRQSRALAAPVLALFAPLSASVIWAAGFSPAARFLVPVAPLIAWPMAPALKYPIIRRALAVVAVFQAAIVAYIWQHPRQLWPKELGTNQVLAAIPVVGPLYERALPSLLTGDAIWLGWLAAAAVAVITAGLVWAARARN